MAQKRNAPETPPEDTTTAEVEEIINADAQTLRPSQKAVLELLYWLEGMATEDTEDAGGGFYGDDIVNILMADTEEEMWNADELPKFNAKVLSGCELELYGIQVKFSNDPGIVSGLIGPDSRRKMFLLVRSARLNTSGSDMYRLPDVGEEFMWNTSARFIVAKLAWMQRRGKFDNGGTVKARITGTDLGAGKSVEKLKPLSAPLVEGNPEEIPF